LSGLCIPASPEHALGVSDVNNVSLISQVTWVICRRRRLPPLEMLCGGVFFTQESDYIDYAEEQLSMRNLASSTSLLGGLKRFEL